MCEKAVDYYPIALEYVPCCYMTQEMCEKAVDTYPSGLMHVSCYKTKKMCEKAIDVCLSLINFVPNWLVINKMVKDLVMVNILMTT